MTTEKEKIFMKFFMAYVIIGFSIISGALFTIGTLKGFIMGFIILIIPSYVLYFLMEELAK